MKYFISCTSAIISTVLIISQHPPSAAGDTENYYAVCKERCSAISGDSKYRCINTCIRTRKKQRGRPVNTTKERINRCNDMCKSFSGIDGVRCIRICLENSRGRTAEVPGKGNVQPDNFASKKCRDRCSFASGAMKYRCLKRCENEKKSRLRDPLRDK